MSRVTLSRKNKKRPAPLNYRRFENAYFLALAPAIGTLIMGWGFSDLITTRLSLLLVVLGGVIKGLGVLLANGEVYVKETSKEEGNGNGGGAVIPDKGF